MTHAGAAVVQVTQGAAAAGCVRAAGCWQCAMEAAAASYPDTRSEHIGAAVAHTDAAVADSNWHHKRVEADLAHAALRRSIAAAAGCLSMNCWQMLLGSLPTAEDRH